MNDLMLDLETLGTKSNSVILSIGAVFFNPITSKIGDEFYCVIDRQSCYNAGLEDDQSTIDWWHEQSNEAREAVFNNLDRISLANALIDFDSFIRQNANLKTVKVWGNGSGFDNVILNNAYRAINVNPPWSHRNDRDVRTIVDLGRDLGIDPKSTMVFEGTKHNALADAIHQAKYLSVIFQHIFKNK